MNRAGQLADARECLRTSEAYLTKARADAQADDTPIMQARVLRGERAVAAWQAEIDSLEMLLKGKGKQ
jgi:hypothetical protein